MSVREEVREESVDVIIVGGGPIGVSCGVEIHKIGLQALVFMVIAFTVLLQGMSGGWVARLLGLSRPVDRGYAIVTTAEGVVTDAAATAPGTSIDVRLARGELSATVDETRHADDTD